MKNNKPIGLNDPLYHACHAKPVTRRDFIAQGFMAGMGHRKAALLDSRLLPMLESEDDSLP